MEVQAIQQGECTNCGKSNGNWQQVQRDFSSHGVDRLLLCDCNSRASVRLCPDGVVARGRISHESASWNEEDDSDE